MYCKLIDELVRKAKQNYKIEMRKGNIEKEILLSNAWIIRYQNCIGYKWNDCNSIYRENS